MSSVAERLRRQLAAAALAAGAPVAAMVLDTTPWSSITFTGERLRLLLTGAATEAFDAWLATIPDLPFILVDHLVADCAIEAMDDDGRHRHVTVGVLTLRDG